jgi:hypothetical protein
LLCRLFRRRHTAVHDHALGEADSRFNVSVISHDMFNVCEAVTGGILDTPSLPIVRPLDLGPQLTIDRQVVGVGIDTVGRDQAVASRVVVGVHFGVLSLPKFYFSLSATPE